MGLRLRLRLGLRVRLRLRVRGGVGGGAPHFTRYSIGAPLGSCSKSRRSAASVPEARKSPIRNRTVSSTLSHRRCMNHQITPANLTIERTESEPRITH